MSHDRIDLHPGSVLHIKGYTSRGHPRKDKHVLIVLILGRHTEFEVLGFPISSQLGYLPQEAYKREVVRIPDRATAFLRYESIIQCFELERLLSSSLCQGFEEGAVTNAGRLPLRWLYKVRAAVRERVCSRRWTSSLHSRFCPRPERRNFRISGIGISHRAQSAPPPRVLPWNFL
jgi:hypothetical protein